jgi:hypothetical protein
MSASEPRTSATRRSLVVEACAQTALSACGNEITYAVGCGRAIDAPSLSAWASEGERDSGAEGMSTFGRRSQTMSILSSEEWMLGERGQASKEGFRTRDGRDVARRVVRRTPAERHVVHWAVVAA